MPLPLSLGVYKPPGSISALLQTGPTDLCAQILKPVQFGSGSCTMLPVVSLAFKKQHSDSCFTMHLNSKTYIWVPKHSMHLTGKRHLSSETGEIESHYF